MQPVLLAFDSKYLTLILKKMLADFGFEVKEAKTVIDVSNYLKQNENCIIFMDWMLDGQETVEIMKEKTKKQHIIIVSKQNDPQKMASALKYGAAEYIMKPFDNDILQSKLSMAGLL